MSTSEVLRAYRHLYRTGLRAIHYSYPARLELRDILGDCFRSQPSATFSARRIENTLRFLEKAGEYNGTEHKILKNLLFIKHWKDRGFKAEMTTFLVNDCDTYNGYWGPKVNTARVGGFVTRFQIGNGKTDLGDLEAGRGASRCPDDSTTPTNLQQNDLFLNRPGESQNQSSTRHEKRRCENNSRRRRPISDPNDFPQRRQFLASVLPAPSQFTSWVIHLGQSMTPAAITAEGVAILARQIEAAAATAVGINKNVVNGDEQQTRDVDAIFLGFHYLGHTHEPTLRLFDPDIPVLATPEVQAIIKPWNHFSNIMTIPSLKASAKSWRTPDLHPGDPFPLWLTPIRLLGHHELNYVTVFIWTHPNGKTNEIHEAILQTPHGTKLDVGSLEAFLDSESKPEKLALLHGLKESRAMGKMNTYGAAGGLTLYRKIGGAKYWVPTHDSELWYSGVLMRLMWVKDTVPTLQWALEEEAKTNGKALELPGGTPNLIKVENGHCFVLI
ncbi:hypothetical protein H2202_006635 [Exophiala xenobiotica]|nr:hypothetical protein H2202_006635 [Exophiala xenobiotica]KAK5221936.1 hypothetical protein LTR72_006192 [Exophiala xenobiotica]KAK5250465.1 hypothetical protein LTS06_004718 [Exophiala xenobiotica]KAK5262168.1 hypothetical protein LTR40_000734 [Exophiala xenobiotica]KAK5294972.1 hypothetical protein LTR14_004141 [Exophiala xenobiotica]